MNLSQFEKVGEDANYYYVRRHHMVVTKQGHKITPQFFTKRHPGMTRIRKELVEANG